MHSYSDPDPVLAITRALGCQTRLHVLRVVGNAPDGLRLRDVTRAAGIAPSTTCYHLGILLEAGLLTKKRKGCRCVYTLADTRYSLAIETAS